MILGEIEEPATSLKITLFHECFSRFLMVQRSATSGKTILKISKVHLRMAAFLSSKRAEDILKYFRLTLSFFMLSFI